VLPVEATIAIIESELEPARRWAGRRGVILEWLPDSLQLRATIIHAESRAPFYIRGLFDDYRALPPMWTFCSGDWDGDGALPWCPKPEQPHPYGSVMFLKHQHNGGPSHAVICVHFNRLAYSAHKGPHTDWAVAEWEKAAPEYVRGLYVADMLSAIDRDLQVSHGRMSDA
jgi:hypothetical protein